MIAILPLVSIWATSICIEGPVRTVSVTAESRAPIALGYVKSWS